MVGAPQGYGAQGAVMCALRFGYRSPPFLDGSGLALELALNTSFHGGFSGDPQATAAADEQGLVLLHMGGDMRLFFRARARLQPYLQLGAAYTALSSGGEETPALTGAGVIAGGGLLYWIHPHFALDLGLRYDGARLDRSRTVQALGLGLGIKIYL